jgi:glycosyltransferase involved in cell wall biosynthesis
MQTLKNYESKSIYFIGFTDSIVDYYRVSDFFISSSLTEGFPMAVLEAMSVGLVPVLSEIEPHKEIVKNTNLPLFNSKNSQALCDCLNDAVANKKVYKETSSLLVKSYYTAEIMSKSYQEIYRN